MRNLRRLIDVPQCVIGTPAVNRKLEEVRKEVKEKVVKGELSKMNKGATILLREDSNGDVETNHNKYISENVVSELGGEIKFEFKAGNFFQNNPFMIGRMVDYVLSKAKGLDNESGGGWRAEYLIDTYCGSGLFAVSGGGLFKEVYGIEVNERAIEEAERNAEINEKTNVKFKMGEAENIFNDEEVKGLDRSKTTVVMDPPRKGSSPSFLRQLLQYRPERIVYMSCGPDTQARDTKVLREGGYEVRDIQPMDLFPQTRHIECCAVFDRVR
jgi:23S rRNA (uracil1939-C5)-methyltransferase/tRNA (uracil-5-)-methyltransferase